MPVRPRRRDDRGAVATVVAILLASGVLLGFLALVVDVGQIYVEREELLTGADAAVLAVARACARETPACDSYPDILDEAQDYADINSADGVSNVVDVCGRLPGKLPDCDPPTGNLTDCLGTPPTAPTSFVEVRLSTELPDGRFALPPAFAQAMAGNAGFDGASVAACARATFEREEDVKVLAMTISTCELDDAPVNVTEPYGPSEEYRIDFLFSAHGGCGFNPPGSYWVEPGRAGWPDGDGQCLLDLPADGRVWGDDLDSPGFQPPGGCANRLNALRASGDVIWVPVHDARHDAGSATEYRHVSVAPFVVTGYYFGPGNVEDSTITGDPPCTTTSFPFIRRCVSGVVVGPAQPLSSLNGAAIVKLIG